jgi:hypothetical protein
VKGVGGDMDRLGIGSILQTSYTNDKGIKASFRW